VLVFSFGFGKRLFGFRRGSTDYRVSLIPLGGYYAWPATHRRRTSRPNPDEFLFETEVAALPDPARRFPS